MRDAWTPEQVFRRLVDGVAALVAGDATQVDALTDLYAEATNVVHPLVPDAPPLRSRDDVRRHFARTAVAARGLRFSAEGVRLQRGADPEVLVAEFTYRGTGPAGAIAAPCVFVMRVRAGRIVESRDYIDHAAFARAAAPRPAPVDPRDWPGRFTERVNAGDLDGALALYAAEARFVTSSGETLEGRDRIRDVLSGLVAAKTRMESRVVQAITAADVAVLYTDFRVVTADATREQHAIEVLRRGADGGWRLVIGDPGGRRR